MTAVTRRVRIVVAAAAAVGVAGTATGITYAATAAGPPATVRACASHAGTLALLSSKGTCPKGYAIVTINRQGRTGATGTTGRPGARGPGAVSLVASSASGAVHQQGREIGGTGVFVQVRCATDATAAELTIYDPNGSTTPFDVRGSSIYTGSTATTRNGTGTPVALETGSSLVSAAVTDPFDGETVENSSGSLSQQLIVTRLVGTGTAATMTTFTVSAFSTYTARTCLIQAQATPTT